MSGIGGDSRTRRSQPRSRRDELPAVTRGRSFTKRLGAHTVLVIASIVSLTPTVYMIDMSFRNSTTAFSSSLIVVSGSTIGNYTSVLSNPDLPQFFINSLIVAVSTVVLTVLIALLAGFAMSRLRIVGGRLLFIVLSLAIFIPLASILVPVVLLIKTFNGLNTYWGLIGPYTAIGVAFAILIIKGALDSFPPELEEAARIDGASWIRVLVRVIVPSMLPALLVVAVWQFLFSWNEFYLALVIMTNLNRETMPLAPLYYEGPFLAEPGQLFAILSLISVVPMVFYLAVQRRFVRALAGGALKG